MAVVLEQPPVVTVMFDEQEREMAAMFGVLVLKPIVPGAVTEGDQVWPPSRLTSVNTSKKLLIW